MDLSKLPKLSQTPEPPQNDPPKDPAPRSAERANIDAVEAGAGGMLWVSIVLGLLCMAIGRDFASYAFAKIAGREYHTGFNWSEGPQAGKEVAYWDLQGSVALTNTGVFLFGLAMVLEGLALAILNSKLPGKKIILAISLTIIILSTAVNLFTCMKLIGAGITPLISALAVALGGYMAMYQWKLLRVLSSARPAPMT